MKKNLTYFGALMVVTLLLVQSSALATPTPGSALQNVFNNITSPYPGVSSVNVTADFEVYDAYWSITASGTSAATIIIELAGFASSNAFGIYDRSDSTKAVQIFSGAASAGAKAAVTIDDTGSIYVNFIDTGIDFAGNQFGYYLDTPNGKFFSDTLLNGDSFDHMFAYAGEGDIVKLPLSLPGTWTTNEYALAWEDLYGGGDADYDDFVVMVESVEPIPEPGTLILLGSGLVSLAMYGKFRLGRKKK